MYTFRINPTLTDEVLQDLIKAEVVSENQEYLEEKYEDNPLWGLAVLEADNIDVELNLGEYGAEYFICAKEEDGEWESVGYVDDFFGPEEWTYCDVEFEDDDWKDQLEKEMIYVLNKVERRLIWRGAEMVR